MIADSRRDLPPEGHYERALADFDHAIASTRRYAWADCPARRDLPAEGRLRAGAGRLRPRHRRSTRRCLGDCQPRPDLPADGGVRAGAGRLRPRHRARRERCLGDCQSRRDLPAEGRLRAGAGRLRPRHRARREVCLGDCPHAARPTARRATTSGRWPTSTAPSSSTQRYAWAIAHARRDLPADGRLRAGAGRLRPRHRARRERCLGHCPVAARPTGRWATTSRRWPTSTAPSSSTDRYAWVIAERGADLPAEGASTSRRWPTSTAPSNLDETSMPGLIANARPDLPARGRLRAGAGRLRPRHRARREECLGHCQPRRDLPADGRVRAGAGRLRPGHRARREVCLGHCQPGPRPTGRRGSTSRRWPTSTGPSSSTRSTPGPLPSAARPTGRRATTSRRWPTSIGHRTRRRVCLGHCPSRRDLPADGRLRAGTGRLRPGHRPRREVCLGHRQRGETYRQMGEYERALADFDQAIELDRKGCLGHCHRGETYRQKGEYERALADFDQAIELDSNDWSMYGGHSRIVPWGRRAAQSLIWSQRLTRRAKPRAKRPDDWQNRLNLALYYVASGDHASCRRPVSSGN